MAFAEDGTGSITYCDAFLTAPISRENTDHGEAPYHYYDAAQQVTPGTGCVIPGINPDLCDVAGGKYWLKTTSPLHTRHHGETHANDPDVPTSGITHSHRDMQASLFGSRAESAWRGSSGGGNSHELGNAAVGRPLRRSPQGTRFHLTVYTPEPSSLLGLAAGIGGLGLGLLRKRRS